MSSFVWVSVRCLCLCRCLCPGFRLFECCVLFVFVFYVCVGVLRSSWCLSSSLWCVGSVLVLVSVSSVCVSLVGVLRLRRCSSRCSVLRFCSGVLVLVGVCVLGSVLVFVFLF